MVVKHTFQDIFDASAKVSILNLPQQKETTLKIAFGTCKDDKIQYNGLKPPLPFATSEIFYARVIKWRRLTAVDKACKAVYEVSFDVKGSNLQFKAGDTIGIIPQNSKNDVDFIINHLNVTSLADVQYTLSEGSGQKSAKTKIPVHIPSVATLRHVFTHCVDFRTIVKKLFLLSLSSYTKDERERNVLEYLCSKEGSAAYTSHILNTNICLLDVLTYFKSCKPPVEVLLQHLPRLLPRPYSIVNSSLKYPDMLKICFSVMDIGKDRKGLTTGWLENIILNRDCSLHDSFKQLSLTASSLDDKKVPIYLRKNINCFELPGTLDTPLILIGPGTGVAPYVGFLEEIEKEKKHKETKNKRQKNSSNEEYPIWLFYGCRDPKLDFIYEKELNDFIDNDVLTCLITAFSRCENHDTKYVQDAITKHGEDVVKLIKQGAKIFVCGDLKTMATQVKETIIECLVKYDGKTKEEAQIFLSEMQTRKLYIVDIWN